MSHIRTIHLLLGVQSIIVILLTINRLSTLTLSYVAPNEFLRWVDVINMLVLPLVSLVAFYLLKKHLERGRTLARPRTLLALNVMFIVGVYVLAASYGDHEVTNYLNTRYCIAEDAPALPARLCEIIAFNDDEFSHWLFFAGFVMMNASLLLIQIVFPHQETLTAGDRALLVINGLFIAAGVFANLAFEVIGLDLYVVALLAVLAFFLWWRKGGQPLVIYYSTAYSVGLVGTFIYKLLLP